MRQGFIDNILSKLEKQNKMLSEQIENKDKYIVLYKECYICNCGM